MSVFDYEVQTITGETTSLEAYRGKTLLIVNVASQCGLTPQYSGLQSLYEKYRDRGLVVLGFPCNQFGSQEPGTEDEIQQFCETQFQVNFPLFAKIEVNGSGTHPLFAYLKKEGPGTLGNAIKWNFTKFLVDKHGNVVKRYAPTDSPDKIEKELQAHL